VRTTDWLEPDTAIVIAAFKPPPSTLRTAASLIICVGAGAGYRLVDERWSDTLRIAVDETLRMRTSLRRFGRTEP